MIRTSRRFVLLLALVACAGFAPAAAGASDDEEQQLYLAILSALKDCDAIQNKLARGEAQCELGRSLADLGRFEEARQVAEERPYLHWGILMRLAERAAEEGRYDFALDIVDELQMAHWKRNVLNQIARTLIRRQRRGKALEVIRRSEQIAAAEKLVDYSALADVAVLYAAAGDRQAAGKAAARAMPLWKKRLRSSKFVLIDFPEKLASAGLFDEALEAAGDDPLRILRVARYMAGKGQYDRALKATAGLPNSRRASLLAEIAAHQAREGKEQAARATLEEARALVSKMAPGPGREYVRAQLANSSAAIKDAKTTAAIAEETKRSLGRANLPAEAVGQLAADLAKTDTKAARELLAKAVEVARSLPDSYNRAHGLYYLAGAQEQIGDRPAARRLFAEAAEIAAAAGDKKPGGGHHVILRWVATAQAGRGWREEALKNFDLAVRLAVSGGADLDDAASDMASVGFYSQALQVARKIELPSPRQATYATVARLHAAAQGIEPAMKWVAQLKDPRERAAALAGLVEGYLQRRASRRATSNPAKTVSRPPAGA